MNAILTKREKEVMQLLMEDVSTKEIADKLFISYKTVNAHVSKVLLKLNVKTRLAAIVTLMRNGILK